MNPPTQPQAPSPLVEAKADSLNELFLRVDQGLSKGLPIPDSDIDAVVLELRGMRKNWELDEASGKKKATKAPKGPPKPTLSLSDLDLDLDA